jgi:N-acetylglucosamine kinase-like BadF-type ATPase
MILIADSGSTKAAWRLANKAGVQAEVVTQGMNPFFRTTDDVAREIGEKLFPVTGSNISEIWFYGAGVVSAEKGDIIKNALKRFYPEASIETQSDLLGACHALLGNQSGIACIMGTGSNACFYNGKIIAGHVSPLGFILGDEGSGAVMGKNLLGDYFKQVMPAELRTAFQQKFNLTREEALNRVYRELRPNQFLATFTPFLSENLEHPYCQLFVETNFKAFIERNVLKLPSNQNTTIGFAGSVAWHFSSVLKKVLKQYNFSTPVILKDPIDGLVQYHIQSEKV